MATKKFLIIGGCNVVFIVIIFILVFVPINNDDFGSTEAIGIVSVIWCFTNSLLAFYFLKPVQTDNDLVINRKDYMHSGDDSQHDSDEDVQILVKDEGGNTTEININGDDAQIELTEIQTKYDAETEKRQQIEFDHNEIRQEYENYKLETLNTVETNSKLKADCEHLLTENEQYKQQMDDLRQHSNNGMDQLQINKLKKELAAAQKTIIEMTSVVGVQQKFPTVQETIQQFRSIRDQKHHDTSTLLKKFIRKQHENNKWQKYFINQIVHAVMFDILCECYTYLESYRLQIYDRIANILNMKNAIAESFDINDIYDTSSTPIIQKHQIRLLSNIFGPYFKNNFKFVLQKKLYPRLENVNQENEHLNINGMDESKQEEEDLVSNVLRLITDKYSDYLTDLNEEGKNGLCEYIIECSEVCWVMILQDPALDIKPLQWRCAEDIVYDERYHKRVLGSDRNCKNILYIVWPAVARNDVILGDQKIDVILRENLYTPFKEKPVPKV